MNFRHKSTSRKLLGGFFKWLFLMVVIFSCGLGNIKLNEIKEKGNNKYANLLLHVPRDEKFELTMKVYALEDEIALIGNENEYLKSLHNKHMENISNENSQYERGKMINAIANNLGGVFRGKSTYIYNKCKEYNINPLLVVAIMKHETGNGTSHAVRYKNNTGGLMRLDGMTLQYFKSLDAGINRMIRLLAENYIGRGLVTIEQIQKKYCPIGATNDPTKINRHWLPLVTKYYTQLLEQSR